MRPTARRSIDEVVLAEPRGFCAGVEMAVRSLAWMLRIHGAPVYCVHEIVHNRLVVEAFEAAGVVFVDAIEVVPAGKPVMLSAHGSAPVVVAAAHDRSAAVVDAICPLVAKVHHELRTHTAAGGTVLHVGHAGHDEVEAVRALNPAATAAVSTPDDARAALARLGDTTPVALLAQTTLAVDEWAEVLAATRSARPDVVTPRRDDLCYATTNRQAAVRDLAQTCDALVVVGSANSSNTTALVAVARDAGCPHVQRVDTAEELDLDAVAGARRVGVTAGASAPERAVRSVVARLRPGRVLRHNVVAEDEYFPPPPALRTQIGALQTLVAASLFAPSAARGDDRTIAAADVLAGLAANPPARAAGESRPVAATATRREPGTVTAAGSSPTPALAGTALATGGAA